MQINRGKKAVLILLLFVLVLIVGCNRLGNGKVEDDSLGDKGNENLSSSELEDKEDKEDEVPSVSETENKEPDAETEQKGVLMMVHSDEWIFLDNEAILEGEREEMECDLDGDGNFEFFSISRDSPNGTRVLAVTQQLGFNLAYDSGLDSAFDDFGHLKEGYGFQITCYDLDNDGIKEVIVSVGNQGHEMQSVVYKYTKSADKPFELVENIDGQEKMYIEDEGTIIAPYGSQGLFNEHKL